MVAGHLHEKNGYYYIILNLTDSAGKRKPKWISTGLTIKGNKKRAEQMLMEERRKYANAKTGDDVLFADFMEQWLEIVKSTVSIPTYSSYVNAVKSIIAPYFRKKKIICKTSADVKIIVNRDICDALCSRTGECSRTTIG